MTMTKMINEKIAIISYALHKFKAAYSVTMNIFRKKIFSF